MGFDAICFSNKIIVTLVTQGTLPSYWVSSLFSNPCQCKNLSFPGPIQASRSEELESLCRYLSVPTNITSLLQWSQDSGSITSSTISTVVKRLASLQNMRIGIKYDVYCFEGFMASSSLGDVTFIEHRYVIGLFSSDIRWCSHEHVRKTLATAGVESLGWV